jgi:membrane fusion protein, heavy metal efflux system
MTDERRAVDVAPVEEAASTLQRRRLRLTAIIAGAAAASVMGLFGWGLIFPPGGRAAAPQPTKAVPGTFRPTPAQLAGFTIEPVRLATFRSERVTDGSIALDESLTTPVFSPYSGRVVRLIARLGDRVERGAPLFAVEASESVEATSDLIAAVAALQTAKAELGQAQTNEKRAHELYLAKGGALKDWEQSRTELAAAQNALRSAEIALAAVRNRLRILGKSESEIAALESQPAQQLDPVAVVSAPIAGTVTQRQIGLGQYIQSGSDTPVYTIGDLSTVWLVANVREGDVPLMRVGTAVAVIVPAYPGRVFNATISWVAAGLDANTHRLPVRADIANPDGALKPQMFANFTIITGAPVTAPAVPTSAIVYEGDTARVWVAHNDGTIAARSVTAGRTQNGLVEITGGLTAGEKIVTRGTLFIDRAGGTG